ncbi:putative ricin b lectin [Diaporthe ampelina]|uniref:Putative ricin b lectin n=1 Tax=Diaporthe ampelina TaxID=1214573 RepID=A0A0G2H3U0_9PEZI|nr:putative ricin b lectin [Diaporthe ampelina]
MRFHVLTSLLALASTTSAAITWTLQKAANPTSDQADAYLKIEAAMKLAVAHYAKFSDATKTLTVQYEPSVATADANYNGNVRFGSNRSYMTERTAMHEISHTLGIGQTSAFDTKCAANDWATATPLLRSWDGSSAKINCGGGHIWPYGLNYETEWSTTNADRHVQLIDAMLADGL